MPDVDYSPTLLERYLKLEALAERGEGGEQDTAQRLAATMAHKYPGIQFAAHEHRLRQEAAKRAEARGETYPEEPDPGPSGGFDYENLWQMFNRVSEQVRAGASWAASAAYEVMQADVAREAAEELFVYESKVMASGKWRTSAKIDLDQLDLLAQDMTPVQREIIADTVADIIREEVLFALDIDVGEDEELG